MHRAKFGEAPAFPSSARSMAELTIDLDPVAAASGPAQTVDITSAIGQLTEMGFERQLCVDVLRACNGDVEHALGQLLG